ncbi:glutamate-cysteine ligase family protein [Kribbella catacumbae]|uniref:glutamate-cysteine ligase family protein n=1 Tax=Kribbella catacumbae TaxID=460086 RepID=UPI00037D30CB|nr:glutamate-cysteine ligase family protein [Kribbella catacumbae]
METKELHALVAGLFARGHRRTTRVAVEQEFLVADIATGAAVPIDRVRRAARTAYANPYLSFEPGGQLELSLPCSLDPAADLCALTDDLQRHLATDGIRIDALPCDPRPEHEVPLQLTTPRYVAMHRHFDAIGPAGRRMMRRTASTQACLDWWPGRAGEEQWQVLNLAGPFLAARFARSTGLEGRLATWLDLDPARTGFDDRLLRGDPITAYTEFAAGAAVFTSQGPADHLTTLFPPVRPRATYLEVRYLDAQEPAAVAQVVTALSTLMYDDDRRQRTLQELRPELPRLAEHWRAAAMGDPATADRGRELDLELVA